MRATSLVLLGVSYNQFVHSREKYLCVCACVRACVRACVYVFYSYTCMLISFILTLTPNLQTIIIIMLLFYSVQLDE